MPIITLTSDLGLKDHYVSAVKGSILSATPNATFVDISHLVQPYNILEASYIIKNAYKTFPEDTIHVIFVNISDNQSKRFLVAQYNRQIFIGSDNGIFPLLFDNAKDVEYFEVRSNSTSTVISETFIDTISNTIKDLSGGRNIRDFGKQVFELQQKTVLQPVVYPDVIRGSIFYIDRFSNAIANIQKEIFQQTSKDRNFQIIFNRNSIDTVCHNYADVAEGEKLCLFNSSGFLELAINKGKASSLLGLDIGSNVLIEFS